MQMKSEGLRQIYDGDANAYFASLCSSSQSGANRSAIAVSARLKAALKSCGDRGVVNEEGLIKKLREQGAKERDLEDTVKGHFSCTKLPTAKYFIRYAKALNISRQWLETGEWPEKEKAENFLEVSECMRGGAVVKKAAATPTSLTITIDPDKVDPETFVAEAVLSGTVQVDLSHVLGEGGAHPATR